MTQQAYSFPDFWTEEDLDALPDDGHRYEIFDGSLHVTPPPSFGHQLTVDRIAEVLRAAAPTGYVPVTGVGVRVPGGNLVPDVTVLDLPDPAGDRDIVWWEPADVALVVEVASPSTRTTDRVTKVASYAAAGIPSYWRIGQDGTVDVHALVAEGQYGLITTVEPGKTWTATHPFEVELTPGALP